MVCTYCGGGVRVGVRTVAVACGWVSVPLRWRVGGCPYRCGGVQVGVRTVAVACGWVYVPLRWRVDGCGAAGSADCCCYLCWRWRHCRAGRRRSRCKRTVLFS